MYDVKTHGVVLQCLSLLIIRRRFIVNYITSYSTLFMTSDVSKYMHAFNSQHFLQDPAKFSNNSKPMFYIYIFIYLFIFVAVRRKHCEKKNFFSQ